MTISLFVYYNVLVHISKTTKDTTSAQENFFVYVFCPIEWWKNQTCSMWFIFLQLFAYGHVQVKCGPGLNYIEWGRFFSSDIITFPINRSWKKIMAKFQILWPWANVEKSAYTLLGVLFGELTVRFFNSPCFSWQN